MGGIYIGKIGRGRRRERRGEREHTGAQGCTGTVGAYRDCSAAGAGAKRSLARPPPRGGLVTSAILSVRRATAVYTISTFWQRRRHRVHELNRRSHDARRTISWITQRVVPPSSLSPLLPRPVVAHPVRRSVIRTGHASRTDYKRIFVSGKGRVVVAVSQLSRVLLPASARRSATLPKWRCFLSLMCTTTTTRRRTVGSHAVDALAGGISVSESSNT